MEGRHDSDDLLETVLPERGDLDNLSDLEAEVRLNLVLASLALYGIMIHRCEHFSTRDMLHLIYDDYAQTSHVHPGMLGTGWTTNYNSAESCDACTAELEADWKENCLPDPPF